MGLLPPEAFQRDGCRGLLGGLLRAALAAAQLAPRDARDNLEAAVVRWALFARHEVGHLLAVAGQRLLQSGLEVEELLRSELDLLSECRDDRLGGCREPVVEIAGADRRLADRR